MGRSYDSEWLRRLRVAVSGSLRELAATGRLLLLDQGTLLPALQEAGHATGLLRSR